MSGYMLNDESLDKVYSFNKADFQVCRVVKQTQKLHVCANCDNHIPPGHPCYYFVGAFAFQFFYYRAHVHCA